jgi:hypothetical protein
MGALDLHPSKPEEILILAPLKKPFYPVKKFVSVRIESIRRIS